MPDFQGDHTRLCQWRWRYTIHIAPWAYDAFGVFGTTLQENSGVFLFKLSKDGPENSKCIVVWACSDVCTEPLRSAGEAALTDRRLALARRWARGARRGAWAGPAGLPPRHRRAASAGGCVAAARPRIRTVPPPPGVRYVPNRPLAGANPLLTWAPCRGREVRGLLVTGQPGADAAAAAEAPRGSRHVGFVAATVTNINHTYRVYNPLCTQIFKCMSTRNCPGFEPRQFRLDMRL